MVIGGQAEIQRDDVEGATTAPLAGAEPLERSIGASACCTRPS